MDFMLKTAKSGGEIVPFACGGSNKCKGCKNYCKGCKTGCKGCTSTIFIG